VSIIREIHKQRHILRA